jgi:hypothetical protein
VMPVALLLVLVLVLVPVVLALLALMPLMPRMLVPRAGSVTRPAFRCRTLLCGVSSSIAPKFQEVARLYLPTSLSSVQISLRV